MTRQFMNWSERWVGEEIVQTGFVGSTVWGLARYGLTVSDVTALIRLGAVHYTAPTMDKIQGLYTYVVWMCDECHDELYALPEVMDKTIREAVRTTSQEQAKKLCQVCEAQRRGLPELMMRSPVSEDLSNEERAYIVAATAEADNYDYPWSGSDGMW